MPSGEKAEKKEQYFARLEELLKGSSQIMTVVCDNVGSNQMQEVRKLLRGKASILMGKNTMMRKVIRGMMGDRPELERLLPHVKENIGFVFVHGDISEVRSIIVSNRRPAPARAGTFAPEQVVIPAGGTGLDPSQTSFFQALNIATKINKGQIEIVADVQLIKEGEKVGTSEVALLQKLNIKPFKYGLKVRTIFDDGCIYDPEVLDLTEADLLGKFMNGVANVAAMSRAINLPTAASMPHIMLDGFKNLVALIIDSEYSFKEADALKNFQPAAVAAPVAAAPAAEKKAEKKEEKKEEKVEEEDADMGFSLFD